ncbi:MAG: hypothetical protein B6245_06610 [Desulfobacteraceae bacterium 4572_88]|nr:MAG: hypothetical protein B6245_06610 [Desulfobacteraceae bacterium 4572_88]
MKNKADKNHSSPETVSDTSDTKPEQIRKQLRKEIQKRRQAEAQAFVAQKEWERTFDAIDDFVTILDTEKRILRMNRAIARTFVSDPELTVGRHCYRLFWKRSSPCRGCPASLVLEDHASHTAEFENHRLEKTFLVSASPIFDETRHLIGIVHVTKDITRRKHAENALRMAYDEMEVKVRERTAELTEANAHLRKEIAERKRTESLLLRRKAELDFKSRHLEEANIALKMMLKVRAEDKRELEEKVLSNVRELILPYLEKLRHAKLTPEQAESMDMLRANIDDIISPFANTLSSKYLNLTPKEIQVANLVKSGKTNKEMAELLNVSQRAIEFHRENIRKKLGVRNKKINLRSHMMSFQLKQ